jgi:hypothetical protein
MAGVARSTMDQRCHEHGDTGVRWRTHRSEVSNHYRAGSSPAGQKRERGARGSHFRPHQGSGGNVVSERW